MAYHNPEFRQAVRRLRKSLPPPYPVVIRTGKLSDTTNAAELYMHYKKERRWFSIKIARMNLSVMRDALCHEWAHMLDWSDSSVDAVERKRKEHTAKWGAIYAKCYRLVFNTEN